MNYAQMRDLFLQLLNRTDITNDEADGFLSLGLNRVQRLLRTPLQKHTETYPTGMGATVPVPFDYLGMVDLRVNDTPLQRVTQGVRYSDFGTQGEPQAYVFENTSIRFLPPLREDDVIELSYYREIPSGTDDEEFYAHTSALPDLIAYAALVFAADYYVDDRKADWKTTMGELVTEVQEMADRDLMAGGVAIRNPYEGIC